MSNRDLIPKELEEILSEYEITSIRGAKKYRVFFIYDDKKRILLKEIKENKGS